MNVADPSKLNRYAIVYALNSVVNDIGENEQTWQMRGVTWIGVRSSKTEQRERLNGGGFEYLTSLELISRNGELRPGERVDFDNISCVVQSVNTSDRGFDLVKAQSHV